ncbi:MAG: hypothetical protein HY678_02680 [Chloroflexi bacterium]|nr:hypothetical protein [Chloroflexota bacterium]
MLVTRLTLFSSLLAMLALAGCGGPAGTGGDTKESSPDDADAETPAARAPSRPDDASMDIVFEMRDRYRAGAPIEIRIRNRSNSTTYYYQDWASCFNLKFFDGSTDRRPYPREDPGREPLYLLPGQFIVPEGTHCDLISEQDLRPGEDTLLFVWGQEMCTKDIWGCLERVRVTPGKYRIVGQFALVPGMSHNLEIDSRPEQIARAEWKFVIEPQPDWFAVRAASEIPVADPLAVDTSDFSMPWFDSAYSDQISYQVRVPPNWAITEPEWRQLVITEPYRPAEPIEVVIAERGLLAPDDAGFADGTAYAFNSRITELKREFPDLEIFEVVTLPAGDGEAVLVRSRYTADSGAGDRIDWILGGGLLDTVAYVAFDQERSVSFADERRRLAEAILRSIRIDVKQAPASTP